MSGCTRRYARVVRADEREVLERAVRRVTEQAGSLGAFS
jgi:predicted site-specific integrase-resolvase